MAKRDPAPGRLGVVEGFVNTLDLEAEVEQLGDTQAMRQWFAEHGLATAAPDERYTRRDLERAVAVREALRELLARNAGYPPAGDPKPVLDTAADRARFTLRLDGGVVHVDTTAGGADGAIGRLLAIVSTAMTDGTWSRLKACRADTCQWAFYDHSRNASSAWCDMAICGSRQKMRAYRDRHRKPSGRDLRKPARPGT